MVCSREPPENTSVPGATKGFFAYIPPAFARPVAFSGPRRAVLQRATRTSLCCLLLRGCGLQQPAVLDRPPQIVQQGLPLEPASRQLRGNLAKACSRTMQASKYARRRVSPSCLDLALLLLPGDCLLLRAPWLLNVASVWPALPASRRATCSSPAPPQRSAKQTSVLSSALWLLLCCAAVSCFSAHVDVQHHGWPAD